MTPTVGMLSGIGQKAPGQEVCLSLGGCYTCPGSSSSGAVLCVLCFRPCLAGRKSTPEIRELVPHGGSNPQMKGSALYSALCPLPPPSGGPSGRAGESYQGPGLRPGQGYWRGPCFERRSGRAAWAGGGLRRAASLEGLRTAEWPPLSLPGSLSVSWGCGDPAEPSSSEPGPACFSACSNLMSSFPSDSASLWSACPLIRLHTHMHL